MIHTIEEVTEAEYSLEPLFCNNCGNDEVTFHQYIGDAYCAHCSTWQIENLGGSNE